MQTKLLIFLIDYIVHQNEKTAEKGHKTEEAINTIDDDLTRYLIRLSSEALSPRESEVLTNILDSSRDLERIGDHAEALINLTDYLIRKKVVFSEAPWLNWKIFTTKPINL